MTDRKNSQPATFAHGDGAFNDEIQVFSELGISEPGSPEGYYNLAVTLVRKGDSLEAERRYRQALELRPAYPEAANNLAILLMARNETQEAEALYRVALAERPDYCEAHINLGKLLTDTARRVEALYFLRRAVQLQPNSVLARDRLGYLLQCMARYEEAIGELTLATQLGDCLASSWNNLGTCFYREAKHGAAEHAFRQALSRDSQYVSALSNLLLISNYSSGDRADVFRLHQSFGAFLGTKCKDVEFIAHRNRPDPLRRLRIGFVSGDLRGHSVGYFIESVLPGLVAQGFQLFAYFNYPQGDARSDKFKPLFHQWREVYRKDDGALAEQIRQDEIDILLDLSGHTSHSRLPVFGLMPAPVQLSWIGYPNTTGVDAIDYRLTDSYADPEGDSDIYHTEHLWRLPGSFLCYTPPVTAPLVASPPCLLNGFITFGSFNSRPKLGDECLDLWCRVLHAVPDSRMVLKAAYGMDEKAARESLLGEFMRRGIAGERVSIQASVGSLEKHLESYEAVDIALDSYPYHGTTTTCESLWMGVPVVTLVGDRHVSRVGVSLLSNAGLPQLIAGDGDRYVEIASELASDSKRLKAMRSSMRECLTASRLLDSSAMSRELGIALRAMWETYCASRTEEAVVASCDESVLPMRLQIGGQVHEEGWHLLDIQPRECVDFVGDIRDLRRFSDESYSEIYCSHVLQLVGQQEVLQCLKGLRRILQPGGKLYLSVPDLDVLAWLYANPRIEKMEKFHLMRAIYGRQIDNYDFSFTGFSLGFITDYLADAGFASVEQVPSFGFFDDSSVMNISGLPISLNLIVEVAEVP